jgi:MoxR-like ATPase
MTHQDFTAVISTKPLELHPPLTAGHSAPQLYQAPPGLNEALDVAMLLGVPILLTGAPGAGKTQAAIWLADQLTGEPPLRMDVKSTTLGVDLLYTFDDVARFRDSAAGGRPKPLVRYLRFNALGEAILRAAGGDSVLFTTTGEPLEGSMLVRERDLLAEAFGDQWTPIDGKAVTADLLPVDASFRHAGREARVVLIDELDKAPRDTPNDLLAEVESMSFLIPELGVRVKTNNAVRPVVVITSNAEKPLPEPFLRRCAYFHVPRIEGDMLSAILARSVLGSDKPTRLSNEVAAAVDYLHQESAQIDRKPGTAEALAWITVLNCKWELPANGSLKAWAREKENALAASLGALFKHDKDRAAGVALIRDWAAK